MKTLEEIKSAAERGEDSEVTLQSLNEYITAHPDDEPAITERGLLNWAMGRRSAAINDYLAAIKLNPDSKSKQAIQSAYAILNYYNKDLYNP